MISTRLDAHIRIVKWVALALVAVLASYLFIRFGLESWFGKPLPGDFQALRMGGVRYLAHEEFYRPSESSPFKYSPQILLLVVRALGSIEVHYSWVLYSLASLVTWAWALFSIFKLASPLAYKLLAFMAALAIALIAAWHGHIEHMSYGQADMLTVSAVVGAYMLVARKHTYLRIFIAGALAALAILTKPAATILLLGLAWSGELGVLVCTVFWCIAFTIMSMGILALDQAPWTLMEMTRLWLEGLKQQPIELFSGNLNQAFGAVLARNFGHAEWSLAFCRTFFIGGLVLLICATIRGIFRRSAAERARSPFQTLQKLMVSMGVYLICNPLSWRWNTFLWFPMCFFALLMYFTHRTTSAPLTKRITYNTLMILFLALVTLLQTHVAHALGISEIDVLSGYGLYGWATLILTTVLIMDEGMFARH